MPHATNDRDREPHEAIDIDAPKSLNLAAVARHIDSSLNKKVTRLIDRDPDRALAVIRRWLRQ